MGQNNSRNIYWSEIEKGATNSKWKLDLPLPPSLAIGNGVKGYCRLKRIKKIGGQG